MKRYKNGEIIDKEFKDMTQDELLEVDYDTLTSEERADYMHWRHVRYKELIKRFSY